MIDEKVKLIFSTLLSLSILFFTTGRTVFAALGDLDTTFGNGGVVNINNYNLNNTANDMAIQADGKLVVVGNSNTGNFFLSRYNTDGSVDTSFGTSGRTTTTFSGNSSVAYALVIQPDGKLVAVGEARVLSGTYSGLSRVALVRYNPDGTLDTSFGTNGLVLTANLNNDSASAFDIIIQPDGKLVAAGSASMNGATAGDYALFRYYPDGSLDTNFGNSGIGTTSFTDNKSDYAKALVIQPDGKLVAGGRTSGDAQSEFGLARFNSNGSLDTSFGSGGKATASILGGYGYAEDLILQSNDKLVATGYVYISGKAYVGVTRFNPDGGLDASFDSDGVVSTSIGNYGDLGRSLVLQNDGKLMILATSIFLSNNQYSYNPSLIRYNTDGSLDTTFGSQGKIVTTNVDNSESSSIILQPDGKFVVGGGLYIIRYLGGLNQRPVANAGTDQNANEGQNVTFDGSGSTDLDGQNDIVSYEWNFGDGEFANGQAVNHIYLDNGIYTATLTITDSAGASDNDTSTITVNNIAPIVGAITAPNTPVQLGGSINASANFTDAGILDPHTGAFDWGDGNISQGVITESNGVGNITGSHTYAGTGVYTITLTISDNQNDLGVSTYSYVVIYDSSISSAFVTGSGKISYSGQQAKFGFNSKYQPGATIPIGQLKFNIPNGFGFESTSYDWLVVTGSKSQLKGTGTVNGTGDYYFILTSNDQPDKLRLKVWKMTTNSVIYDNQPGDSDNIDPTTAIDSGNIVIHN